MFICLSLLKLVNTSDKHLGIYPWISEIVTQHEKMCYSADFLYSECIHYFILFHNCILNTFLMTQHVGKEFAFNAGDTGDSGSISGLGWSPGGDVATHCSILAREFLGQRSLAGYSPKGHKESDMTEWLTLAYTRIMCHVMYKITSPFYKYF